MAGSAGARVSVVPPFSVSARPHRKTASETQAVALAIAAEQRRELGAATAAAHGLAEDGTRAAAQLKAFVQAAEADQAWQA